MTAIIRIPQVDGTTREITLNRAEAETVRQDRTMLDYVKAIKIVNVHRDGTRERVK